MVIGYMERNGRNAWKNYVKMREWRGNRMHGWEGEGFSRKSLVLSESEG